MDLSEFQPFELQPVRPDLCEVVLGLLQQPAFGDTAEDQGKSHSHFGRDEKRRAFRALVLHSQGVRIDGFFAG